MRSLSYRIIIGLIFSAIGLATLLLAKQPLVSAIWLSFGNGLILSDLRFTGKDDKGNTFVKPIPPARFYTAIFLIVMAIVLLGLQVYLDFQKAG
ncbi:hypothetical protein ACXYMU_07845 [Pontibacter sp. CAU 1760]